MAFLSSYASSAIFMATYPFRAVGNAVGNVITFCADVALPKNPITYERELRIVIPRSFEKFVGELGSRYTIYRHNGLVNGSTKHKETIEKVEKIKDRILGTYTQEQIDGVTIKINFFEKRNINAFAMLDGQICMFLKFLETRLHDVEIREEFFRDIPREVFGEISDDEYKRRVDEIVEGLKKLSDEDKIAAILSHEIVHILKRDAVRTIQRNILVYCIATPIFYILEEVIEMVSGIFKNDDESTEESAGLSGKKMVILFIIERTLGLLLTLVSLLIDLYIAYMDRKEEFDADKYGMIAMQKAGYNPLGAIWLQDFFEQTFPSSSYRIVRIFEDLFSDHPSHKARKVANYKTFLELQRSS